MTEDELQVLLEKTLSERDRYDLFVEECQDQDVRLRFSPRYRRLNLRGCASRCSGERLRRHVALLCIQQSPTKGFQ